MIIFFRNYTLWYFTLGFPFINDEWSFVASWIPSPNINFLIVSFICCCKICERVRLYKCRISLMLFFKRVNFFCVRASWKHEEFLFTPKTIISCSLVTLPFVYAFDCSYLTTPICKFDCCSLVVWETTLDDIISWHTLSYFSIMLHSSLYVQILL